MAKAKKGSAPPRKPRKAAGAHSAPPPSHARRYSLEDILNEYRDSPVPTPEEPVEEAPLREDTQKAAHLSGAPRPLAEDVRAFAGELRTQRREAAPPSPAEAEEAPAQEEAEESVPESAPTGEKASAPGRRYQPGGDKSGPFHKLYGWLLGRFALLAIRKRMRTEAEEREREALPELAPLEAAKVYASQSPAFFARSRSAALLTLLNIWIALAWGANIPIPGSLSGDVRTAALVSLTVLLTVMLMGLDVLSVGVLSAVGGRPGWETLLSIGCVGSVIDCVYVAVSKNTAAALPPCALCSLAVTLALRGSWYRCRSLKAGFLALHRSANAYSVSEETLSGRRDKYAVKSRRSRAGFIRRSEENDVCEEAGQRFSLYILALLLLSTAVFAIITPVGSRLSHGFAVLSAFCACSPALFALPMLMAPSAERLGKTGCAVSGWQGIERLGKCSRLIVTDSDLFPEGNTAFNAIFVSDGQDTEKVISYTASLIAAAESDLSRLFADLMERSGGRMRAVAAFEGSRTGAKGLIDGVEVMVGNAGYMYFRGIKPDPKLVGENRLFTAFGGELVGAFGVEYTPDPKVRAALQTLNKSGKQPYFAVRDFNIDAQLVERLFRCRCDNFEFPEESAPLLPEGSEDGTEVSAIIGAGGLDRLVDLFESSRCLRRYGLILRALSLTAVGLGLLLGLWCCIRGDWAAVSAARLLLYQVFWLLLSLAMGLDPRL